MSTTNVLVVKTLLYLIIDLKGPFYKVSTFSPKMSTTKVSNHDHDYAVNVLFSNDDDYDFQTLGTFSVEKPNSHS